MLTQKERKQMKKALDSIRNSKISKVTAYEFEGKLYKTFNDALSGLANRLQEAFAIFIETDMLLDDFIDGLRINGMLDDMIIYLQFKKNSK